MRINMSLAVVIFMWLGIALVIIALFELFKYAKMISDELDRCKIREEQDGEDLTRVVGLLAEHREMIDTLNASVTVVKNDIQDVKCTVDAFDACERTYGRYGK